MQKMIATAESCTCVLKNIINDFMDYSVLCSNNMELSLVKKEFSIRSFISRIEHIMIYQLKNQNVAFFNRITNKIYRYNKTLYKFKRVLFKQI